MSLEEDLTVLIAYKKYPRRIRRQANPSSNQSEPLDLQQDVELHRLPNQQQWPAQQKRDYVHYDNDRCDGGN